MISYQKTNQGMFPRVFCEVCKKPINDEDGLAYWSESGEVTHAHVGPCDRKLKRDPNWPNSERLSSFFFNLLHNTQIGPKELKEAEYRNTILGAVASRKKLDRSLQ